jgi:hypothetical protein
VIRDPQQMMALAELAARRRPGPEEYLARMGLDPDMLGEFHLLDLRDTIETLGKSPVGVFDISEVAAIIAAHGTVLLILGHQIGAGEVVVP